ncbi:MAG: hypothetical protein COA33_009870 [Fluviicola sp.]|nr:hypothetical protein [Fluviicola sp.]
MSKKTRILFAAVDIGYRIPHYTRFLEENYGDRVKVESFSKYVLPKEHYKISFTYECPVDKWSPIRVYIYSSFFFLRALFKYDVFHFFSGETILTRKLRRFELMIYKLLKKKVIMHFVGSDIRSNDYLKDKNEHIIDHLNGKEIKTAISDCQQLKLIADTRKYANKIIVSTPDLLELIPEATYLPVFLDVESLPKTESKRSQEKGKIRILHSPSGTLTKGSKYIHDVLTKILSHRKEEIDLIIPSYNKKGRELNYSFSRYKMIETMDNSHIVIDQMVIGWYGLKTVEALYHGANVVCFIEKEEFQFDDSPIIQSDVLNLERVLNTLIDQLIIENNKKDRLNTNRKWIDKNHSIDSYQEFLHDLWLT